MTTVAIALPKIEIDLTLLPDELTVRSLTHTSMPSWPVIRRLAIITTVCDICGDLVHSHDRAYYESGRPHPAHAGCWFIQLTARPIRVVDVRYN